MIIMILGQSEKDEIESDSNIDPSEISIIWRFSQLSNAFSHIFDTFGGIKNSLIFVLWNVNLSIICKFEFAGICTYFNFLQNEKASSHIFETFGGI